MTPFETSPGMGSGGIKKNYGSGWIVYCKNFCKCYNVPPLSTTIKKLIKKTQS
jgi:hypothetical protein